MLEQPFYSRQYVQCFAKIGASQEANQLPHDCSDDDRSSFQHSFIFRYNERFESDRDAGFATSRRSFLKFSDSGQADREPVSIARGVGPNEVG